MIDIDDNYRYWSKWLIMMMMISIPLATDRDVGKGGISIKETKQNQRWDSEFRSRRRGRQREETRIKDTE